MAAASDDGKRVEGRKRARQTPWDPAAVPSPGSPTLQEEEDRQFHATHFTADPRGAGSTGAPPIRPQKRRGGTPPDAPKDDLPPSPARPKRRGGTGPE